MAIAAAESSAGTGLSLLGVLGAIPAIDAAVALVNRGVMRGFGATLLPALELRHGVPAHLRSLIAVPMLLTSHDAIAEQIERLEIHHLASPEGDLHFALLSDWADAATERAEGDTALLQAATAGIAQLNLRYGAAPGGARFLLLHRRRVWNQGEGQWIGWERKRGKLHELNRLLRGAADTSFLPTTARLPPRLPACATSSPSIPIRGCRATPSGGWSARWPIRSTGRVSTPRAGASSKAMACCSRA